MLEDTLRHIRQYYYKMPEWQKRIIGRTYLLLPESIRLGHAFAGFGKLLEESEYWTTEQIEQYQYGQAFSVLKYAEGNIPYYKKKFAEYGVNSDRFKELKDIKYFPYLTKKDIQNNYTDLFPTNFPKYKILLTTTGGSTAEPLKFAQEKGKTRSKERAFIWNGWQRCGYYPGAPCVQLKGRNLGYPDKGIFWEYEPIQNYLEMDSNFLTNENIPSYLDAIEKFSPEFMIGYVSSIFLLARYLKEHPQIKIPKFKTIFLASENVYPWQREYIKKIFKCRVFSHYGHSEMVLLGMECERSHNLHFFPQYGLLEIIGQDGNIKTSPGDKGELVGTSFHNYAMPLIRYRTQDYGIIGKNNCDCGRKYQILEDVEGRLQEFIVTKDNRLISICVMGAAHFDISESVHDSQYYQDKPGQIIFRVVPRKDYGSEDRKKIMDTLEEKARGSFTVEIQEVDRIKKSSTGKHIMIEQKLPINTTYVD
jgi:phenylacetate-CoA ligase